MNEVYSKNPDVIFRKIADEFILVPIRQRAVDLRCVYTLNETAAFIWQAFDGKKSVSQIKDNLAEAFEVESSRAESDISQIVSQWEAMSLIQRA